jgi:hypothetical protein
MFTTKCIHSVYYLQVVFLLHFINRYCLSGWYNTIGYITIQTAYIIYYRFTINISQLLWAPYFIFVKTLYPSLSCQVKEKYTIIKNDYDEAKKYIEKWDTKNSARANESAIRLQALARELGQPALSPPTSAATAAVPVAPPGHTFVGYSTERNPLYKNAQGQIFEDRK